MVECELCGGSGKVSCSQDNWVHLLPCPRCGGYGQHSVYAAMPDSIITEMINTFMGDPVKDWLGDLQAAIGLLAVFNLVHYNPETDTHSRVIGLTYYPDHALWAVVDDDLTSPIAVNASTTRAICEAFAIWADSYDGHKYRMGNHNPEP